MKHLRHIFESYSPEEDFKGKINWKIFEYIKDLTLPYSDQGYIVSIEISIWYRVYHPDLSEFEMDIPGNYNLTSLYIYTVNRDDEDGYIEYRYKPESIAKADQLATSPILLSYIVSIQDENLNRLQKSIIKNISNSVKSKFKEISIKEIHTGVAFLTHPIG